MATKTWNLQVGENEHQVELTHSVWTGARVISVDGQIIEQSRKVFDTGSEHRIDIQGHAYLLSIRKVGMGFEYDLADAASGSQVSSELPANRSPQSSEAPEETIPVKNIVAGVFGLIAFMGVYFKTARPVEGGAVLAFDNLLIGIGLTGALATLFWPSQKS